MELAAFIGLEFSVLPPASEITPHYTHIQKSVGLVTSSRHLSADSGGRVVHIPCDYTVFISFFCTCFRV
uniref:Secreted protein n=1 Tax=Mesocestoides corti TaxID=53468 RepID=A0A5K3FL06_MESCO